jgi:hypothetical protein
MIIKNKKQVFIAQLCKIYKCKIKITINYHYYNNININIYDII